MYILYFKSCEYECQIVIIDVQAIYHIRYFLQKGKLASRSLLSEGRYFRGGSLLSGVLLTPVTFYRYFRRERERENNFREVLLNILVKSRIAYPLGTDH